MRTAEPFRRGHALYLFIGFVLPMSDPFENHALLGRELEQAFKGVFEKPEAEPALNGGLLQGAFE